MTEEEISDEEMNVSIGEPQDTPATTNIETYSDVLNNFRAIQNFALMKKDDNFYRKTTNFISLEKDICLKRAKQLQITDF